MNPVRIRDGTATVCEEAPHVTKVSHWENPEKAVRMAMIRESGDLLKCVDVCLLSMLEKWAVLFCRKSAAVVFYRLPQPLFLQN